MARFRRVSVLVFVLIIPCALSGQDAPERWSLITLVKHHQGMKRDLFVQDVYKMIYQSAFGIEHLLDDTASARRFLREELFALDTGRHGEELVERISMDGEMVRINLRPFKALNLDPDILVEVMFGSARATPPDTVLFYRQWNEFVALVEYGLLVFPREDVATWNARVIGGEIGAFHHSEEYKKANRPAYRVVRWSVFESMISTKK